MYHLTTHAFFKALLFLGAGSVILALHHEQDIWKMGALRQKMPVTFWTFLVGTFALCGVPPFSGFYSKDAILAQASEQRNYALFALATAVVILTAFYMFRVVFVVFFGAGKSDACAHAHESPGVMAWPLRLLAVFSLIGGVIGIQQVYGGQFSAGGERTGSLLQQLIEPLHAPGAALAGLAALALGFGAAYAFYFQATQDPLPQKLGSLSRAMRHRFYFDELYEATVIRLHELASAIAVWFDRWIIAGLVVRGTHGTTELLGRALRLVQTGNLQTYAFLFALGVALVLYLVLGR
jgi:NADH-quinone oxidoreductase subunit L